MCLSSASLRGRADTRMCSRGECHSFPMTPSPSSVEVPTPDVKLPSLPKLLRVVLKSPPKITANFAGLREQGPGAIRCFLVESRR